MDPYQTPQANVDAGHDDFDFDTNGVFSTKGRIGRLRYIAYGFLVALVVFLPLGLIAGLLSSVMGETGMMIGTILMLIGYLAMIVYSVIFGVRRLHDLDMSGWMWLINLVPFVGAFFGLYMIFAPGKEGVNKFGPPPAENPMWVKLLSWGSLILIPVAIGILAAVALPAYQDYVERAAAAEYNDAELEEMFEGLEELEGMEDLEGMDLDQLEDMSSDAAIGDALEAADMSDEEMQEELDKLLKELEQAQQEAQ